MKKILLVLGLLSTIALGTQIIPESVSIGNNKPDASASLHLTGTTKGFIPNKLTTIQRDAIVTPTAGLVIYNTTDVELQVYNGGAWVSVGSGGAGGIAYWITTTPYILDDLVIESNRIWRCTTAHTASALFATDIANWVEVSQAPQTTADLPDSLNKRYVTDANLTTIGNQSGTNTGDNAINSNYSGLVTNATHTGDATGATALTVVGINNTIMSTLGTGILKNTTTTGVPSIAIAADFPILNQSTTGNAATVTNGVYTTNKISALSSTTSAELAGVISDETGTGKLVFDTSPVFTTPNIGTATGSVSGSSASFTGSLVGDISGTQGATAYSGTVPLLKGGTGQTTKTAAFDALSPMTSVGDLIFGYTSGTGQRLAVGERTNVLKVGAGGGGDQPEWGAEDRDNLLANPNFEYSTTGAWTCGTSNTCSKTTTSGEFTEGIAALKVVTSAAALDVKQNVATVSGSLLQYVIGVSYKVPSTLIGFQICTLIAGVEKTCVPTANLIQDNLYHTIEIPEVITAGSDVGIKFKSTSDSETVFFDKAYIKQGLGTQALQLDYTYVGSVSDTGVISGTNKTIFSSCVASVGATTCAIPIGLLSQPLSCTMTISTGALIYQVASLSTTSVVFNGTSGTTNYGFRYSCTKTGNDYLASSAAVYSQASANYDWTSYTPTFGTGLGTVSGSNQCKHRRIGGDLEVNCYFTNGTTAASLASISLPNSLLLDAAKIVATNTTTGQGQGFGFWQTSTVTQLGSILTATGTSLSLVYFGAQNSAANGIIPQNGNQIMNTGAIVTVGFKVPISGWSNSASIVGSFAGVFAPQSWTTYTIGTSRIAGTTYTNSSVNPIMINVSCNAATNTQAYMIVSGKTVSTCGWNSLAGGQVSSTMSAIVPPNATYSVTSGGTTLANWNELN